MSEYKLGLEILDLSDAKGWYKAKQEWYLEDVYYIPKSEEPETCLCGHHPIREICIIRNKENNNTAIVGNCCVNKFVGLETNKIFSAIKKVQKNISKSFNADLISLAYNKNIISDWENNFYLNIWRKRILSSKQWQCKKKINRKILAHQDKLAKNNN